MSIISGGQTGADRAALDAALDWGIAVAGWCPKGRLAEDGLIDDHYPLKETPQRRYAQRTEWNVRDSNGTLIVARRPLTGGAALTESRPIQARPIKGQALPCRPPRRNAGCRCCRKGLDPAAPYHGSQRRWPPPKFHLYVLHRHETHSGRPSRRRLTPSVARPEQYGPVCFFEFPTSGTRSTSADPLPCHGRPQHGYRSRTGWRRVIERRVLFHDRRTFTAKVHVQKRGRPARCVGLASTRSLGAQRAARRLRRNRSDSLLATQATLLTGQGAETSMNRSGTPSTQSHQTVEIPAPRLNIVPKVRSQ